MTRTHGVEWSKPSGKFRALRCESGDRLEKWAEDHWEVVNPYDFAQSILTILIEGDYDIREYNLE